MMGEVGSFDMMGVVVVVGDGMGHIHRAGGVPVAVGMARSLVGMVVLENVPLSVRV